MKKSLITVVGPTAIGKTSLSIKLAQAYRTEIISSDSRQFYKEMNIGTAVPTPEELSMAPHHFIQQLSITDEFSVGHFEREALALIDRLFIQHDQVIMAGGSGLYVKAVTEGLDSFPQTKAGLRKELEEQLANEGATSLQKLLKDNDPIYYQEVDLLNIQRVMRALEVTLSTGKPFSSFRSKTVKKRNFSIIKIGLMAPRPVLYERINLRVDDMVKNGLVQEVESLLSRKHLNALQTVGYRELFEYFEGHITLEEAIEKIKTNTRRFAKRQLTWFKKDDTINWFDYQTPVTDIINFINKQVS